MPKRLTQEEFIARAYKVWGDKFDLSETVYINSNSKIKVRCLIHGAFYPIACNFLSGHGCPLCGREKTLDTIRRDTRYFIRKAKEIHGDKYNYSRVKYKNNREKVEIICPIHGSFFQKPNDHLLGKGCIMCAGTKKLTTRKFVSLANKIHNNEYKYRLTEYEGNKKKVKIICVKHGVFEQTPNAHLLGQGCPKCSESRGEKAIRLYLEKLGIEYEREKSFQDCKDKGLLRFDFYLPTKNTCIEYQGRQHYKKDPFFDNNEEAFINRKRRDEIKREYCKRKGIRLIEIKYNENIKQKLLWNI